MKPLRSKARSNSSKPKGAMKIFEAHEKDAALQLAAEKSAKVEIRRGEETRCEDYCAVAEWCDQFKSLKQGNKDE